MNKSDLIVIARARAQRGKETDLEKALRDVAAPTRMQRGCLDFSLYRSQQDGAVIVGVERWASAEEHNRHLQGPHVQKLMAAMSGILAEPPEIIPYEIIDEL
jgi:quinol monooxygenase YgiN